MFKSVFPENWSTLKKLLFLQITKAAHAIIKTVSGATVHVVDALAKPAHTLVVSMAPIQSGTGDPSPENVRPITGRTGANVYVSPTQDVADATTYPVNWQTEAGTVYGGTVDVVTGVLTVDRASVDLGTLSWTKNALPNDNFRFQSVREDMKAGVATVKANMLCSAYKTVTANDTYLGRTGVSNNGPNKQICICDMSYSDAASFKTAMSGVQLVYELSTPVTYQLTPQEVQMLLGEDYVWSDSGDVSLSYYAHE